MGIVAQQGETRTPIPAGKYLGVVVGVYDIGTQTGGKFGDKRQVVVTFELHKKKGVCRNEEGQPLLTSKFYNLSFGKKSGLRADVESILGRSFTETEAKAGYDVTDLADKVCWLVVKHETKDDGSIRDFIDSFSLVDEDDPEPTSETDTVVFDRLDPSRPFPKEVPEWIQTMVKKSKEYASPGSSGGGKPAAAPAKKRQTVPADDDDDDDPPY
ncbi:phage replication initiation protein, NGO0469 family [Paludisphaera mucosa]|uniref:Uncharacterized protein n=1 Tax=Paludisphaera mucosa TaxID=3030827 RepID=A0ABT6F6Q0_9BACT|nr:hypothetical protein [Paludisphaera mucosa]MDG3003271.1 hypothetical protein [Paludisphaera mucosa]